MLCHLVCVADLRIFGDVALLQVQLLVGAAPVLVRFVGLEVFSSVVLLLLCLFWFLGVCLCFFSVFSLFLVLCDLVPVKLCLAASRIICKLLSS